MLSSPNVCDFIFIRNVRQLKQKSDLYLLYVINYCFICSEMEVT